MLNWEMIILIVLGMLYLFLVIDRICKCFEKIESNKTIAKTFKDLYTTNNKDNDDGDKTLRASEESN